MTGLTISREQLDFARARLGERAEIRFQDYRDTEERFDAIASIEMIEAVGEANWPTYFRVLHDRLKPGGRAGLQIITIQDELFEGYRRRADFIQRYIFPGGMLISEARLQRETAQAGLSWSEPERFGQDYAVTLAAWKQRFGAAWDDIRRLGFDERFIRIWEFYLAYCEAAFEQRNIDVLQYTLIKP